MDSEQLNDKKILNQENINENTNKNTKYRNLTFKIILGLFTFLLLSLIIAAISNVLIKGIAGISSSIRSPEIQFSIKLSLITSMISTFLCILFAVPIAYSMERLDLPGKKIINTILNIPLALPPVVSGVALLLLFGTTTFGRKLASFGLKFVFDVKGVVLAQFFVNISYMIRILKSTFSDIDPKLEFVGRTLGCTQFQSFMKITLPLSKNGLLAGTVITWARALGEFGAALMLAGATRLKTETLPTSLYLNMSTGDIQYAMASATIIILISIVALLVFENVGSGKGMIINKVKGGNHD